MNLREPVKCAELRGLCRTCDFWKLDIGIVHPDRICWEFKYIAFVSPMCCLTSEMLTGLFLCYLVQVLCMGRSANGFPVSDSETESKSKTKHFRVKQPTCMVVKVKTLKEIWKVCLFSIFSVGMCRKIQPAHLFCLTIFNRSVWWHHPTNSYPKHRANIRAHFFLVEGVIAGPFSGRLDPQHGYYHEKAPYSNELSVSRNLSLFAMNYDIFPAHCEMIHREQS